MKELEKHNMDVSKHQVELEMQQKQKQEFKYLNTIKTKKGHKVWEIHLKSEKVVEAQYKKIDTIHINEATGEHVKEIVRRKGCVYIAALNRKNALKRYKENKGSALVPEGEFSLNLF